VETVAGIDIKGKRKEEGEKTAPAPKRARTETGVVHRGQRGRGGSFRGQLHHNRGDHHQLGPPRPGRGGHVCEDGDGLEAIPPGEELLMCCIYIVLVVFFFYNPVSHSLKIKYRIE
jgi:hypothetical protein